MFCCVALALDDKLNTISEKANCALMFCGITKLCVIVNQKGLLFLIFRNFAEEHFQIVIKMT
jgi:hypothetical protein